MSYNYSKRNINIDTLRTLCSFEVVGWHTTTPWRYKYFSYESYFYYYVCGFSMPTFFAITGFLLLNKKNIGFCYLFKKIFANIRFIFLWILVFSLISTIADNHFILNVESVYGFLKKVKSDFFRSIIIDGNFLCFWSLWVDNIIYLILPFLLYTKMKYGLFKLLIYFIIFSSCIYGFTRYLDISIDWLEEDTFHLWKWILYFLLGGLIRNKEYYRKIVKFISLKNNLKFNFVLTILSITHLNSYSQPFYTYDVLKDFYNSLIYVFYILGIFILFLRIKTNNLFKLIGKYISPFTTGIYAVHRDIIKYDKKIYEIIYGKDLIIKGNIDTIIFHLFTFIESFIIAQTLKMFPFTNKYLLVL